MSVAVLSLLLVTAVAVAREETCVSIEGLGLPSFVEHAAEFASVDTAMTGVFHNPLNVPLERYWDDRRGTGGVYQGLVMPHEAESVGTYAGDEFFFREVDSAGGRGAGAVVARFAMDKARTMYILHCNDAAVLASAEYAALLAQQRWAQDYKRASGVPWISHYGASGPRPPPKHRIWTQRRPAKYTTSTRRTATGTATLAPTRTTRRRGAAAGGGCGRARAPCSIALAAVVQHPQPPMRARRPYRAPASTSQCCHTDLKCCTSAACSATRSVISL